MKKMMIVSLLIKDNHMYFVRWDEDGETAVVKYRVSLPEE